MAKEKEQTTMEKADQRVKDIIAKSKLTTIQRLAEIDLIWREYCQEVITNTPKEKLSEVKLPCFNCMRVVFKTLTTEPQIKNFSFGNYVKSEDGHKTYMEHGKNKKDLTEKVHCFECDICDARNAYVFEED